MNNKSAIVYFIVVALDSISYGLIAPILAPLLTSHNSFFFSNHSQIYQYGLYGIFIGIFPLTYMIAAPILGLLSDRYGRKNILLVCLLITFTTFICYAFAFEFKLMSLLIFARVLAGLSAGSQGVAQAAVADFADEKNKPHMISIIAIGMTLGLIIGPLAASIWSSQFNWSPFIIVMIFCLICAVFLWQLPEHINRNNSTFNKDAFKQIIKTPKVFKLLMIFLMFELGWSLYLQSLPLYLNTAFHFQTREIGFAMTYVGSLLAVFLLIGTRISLKYINPSLMGTSQIGLFLGVFGFLMSIFNAQLLLFLIFSLFIVVSVALIYPCIISQLSHYIPKEKQGLLMGITDGLIALAFTVTGFISSLLIYFNLNLIFWIAAFCWVIAISLIKLRSHHLAILYT